MSPALPERRREYMREWRAKHPGYGTMKQRGYRSDGYLRRLKIRIECTERRIGRLTNELVAAQRELRELEHLRRSHTCFGCGKFAGQMIERAVPLPSGRIETRAIPYCGKC
jgi:hypothetical protein